MATVSPPAAVPPAAGRVVRLRIEIEGGWTVAEFQLLLQRLDSAYRSAGALTYLLSQPNAAAELEASIYPPNRGEIFMDYALASVPALRLRAIQFESPGWVEVLGALNPIRVIADLITSWRAENTRRTQQHRSYQLDLLGQIPPHIRAVYAARLLEDTVTTTTEIARDIRISQVALVDPSEQQKGA